MVFNKECTKEEFLEWLDSCPTQFSMHEDYPGHYMVSFHFREPPEKIEETCF